LRGEYVKSYGEKVIANFLFEHDIPYFYEQHHWVSGRNYRPDFTVPKSGSMSQGVVIEYFGLEGEPDYDELSAKKRAYWESRLISGRSSSWGRRIGIGTPRGLRRAFKQKTGRSRIPARRLSEDEIWLRARQRVHSSLHGSGVGLRWALPQAMANAARHPRADAWASLLQ
jgi:DNA helicase-4